ncbi:MAG: carbon-nitrogen hydrolase family protein [Beijerinckiaceae bacterium]
MKVALIQMNSGSDKAANMAQARELVERAIAEEKPDWISLPEVWDFMGGSREDKWNASEKLPGGEAYSMLQELARKHRVHIHGGSILERIDGEERMGNTTVAFDRDGNEVARYRKIHMFDIVTPDGQEYRESKAYVPGNAVVTYKADDITVGCSICYDLRFPYLFAALAEKGADMIALPAAFTLQTGKDHWDVLLRARAIETEVYMCAAGQTGAHQQGNETRFTYGHSLVADPWGHIVAKASDGTGYVAARIDPVRVKKVRSMIPVAQHWVKLP